MRVDSISIGTPDDPAVIQFHPKLTMVAGIGAAERAEIVDLLVAALTATGPDLQGVRYVDNIGRTIALRRDATGVHFVDEHGAEAASPLSLLGLDAAGLRRLMLIGAPDVAVAQPEPVRPVDVESSELVEARTTLAAVQAELAQALELHAQVDARRAEIAAIDGLLVAAREDGAKRRYARLLAELERVRAEAASVRGGSAVADADRRFIDAADSLRRLAGEWRDADERAEAERQRLGNRPRLEPDALVTALAGPDEIPGELEELARRYETAEARRVELDGRLRRAGAGNVDEPRHPAVFRLAHADQDLVWATARRALELGDLVEGHSVALGGLQAGGVTSTAVAGLEAAHDAVDRAERLVDVRFVPGVAGLGVGVLLAVLGVVLTPILTVVGALATIGAGLGAIVLPRRVLRNARLDEQRVLERNGITSYLGLQYRRLEATLNPAVTQPLELAAVEYREALEAWRGLGGDLEPAAALDLEAETRAYVATLAEQQGAADELHRLRTELLDEAEPAVVRARDQLIEACAPFGITDPTAAIGLVRQQASTSTVARVQRDVEAAEAVAAELRSELDGRLAALGFVGEDDSVLGQRLVAFDAARTDARRREQARRTARPVQEVEADLARLEALAASDYQAEWGLSVTPSDAEEPDVEALEQHRQDLLARGRELDRAVPNVERLSDRRDAMQRRVASLTELHGGATGIPMIDAAGLEERLLARLTAARSAGPLGETTPLVLNEPFAQIRGDRKAALLDTLERLSASVQLTYLTDDADAVAWGRRRAAAGAIGLLEPAKEPAGA